jgi:FKBP-type peptidyl-prolyl cis-trans isomerase
VNRIRLSTLRPARRLRAAAFSLLAAALVATACSEENAPQAVPQITIDDISPGSGAVSEGGDTVLFHYVGTIAATATLFESSYEVGIPLEVIAGGGTSPQGSIIVNNRAGNGVVINGLRQGLVGVRQGMRRRITIPPQLAYGGCRAGETPPPNIPPCATLVFEIEVLRVRF